MIFLWPAQLSFWLSFNMIPGILTEGHTMMAMSFNVKRRWLVTATLLCHQLYLTHTKPGLNDVSVFSMHEGMHCCICWGVVNRIKHCAIICKNLHFQWREVIDKAASDVWVQDSAAVICQTCHDGLLLPQLPFHNRQFLLLTCFCLWYQLISVLPHHSMSHLANWYFGFKGSHSYLTSKICVVTILVQFD